MAGQLKRENPDIQEDLVLIRALRDSNLPKFLADDAILFKVSSAIHVQCTCTCTCIYTCSMSPKNINNSTYPTLSYLYPALLYPILQWQGILSDLFPGVTLPEHDYGVLQTAIENAASSRGLQVVPAQVCTDTM